MHEEVFDKMRTYNAQGIFPIPGESEQNFVLRAENQSKSESGKTDLFLFSYNLLQEVYDIVPSWVQVIFEDKGLSFWEAGCTWCDENKIHGYIQLKKKLLKKSTLFGVYDRDEILSHELVHAVRLPLQSKRFEEIFAYLTSYFVAKKKQKNFNKKTISLIRCALGPLFFTPLETSLFLLLTLISCLLSLFFPFILPRDEFTYLFTFSYVPLLCTFSFFLIRLTATWTYFFKCKKNICAFYQKNIDMHNVLAIMVRLSDEDIMEIARGKKKRKNGCPFYKSFIQKIYAMQKETCQC